MKNFACRVEKMGMGNCEVAKDFVSGPVVIRLMNILPKPL